MDYLVGDQLSLIAEDFECDRSDVGDWGVDTRVPLREKSIDEIRAHFVRSVGGKPGSEYGGQIKNLLADTSPPLPPIRDSEVSECPPHGGQNKNRSIDASCPPCKSIFERHEGDDGTWVEKERRGDKVYRYLRWRERDGSKPSRYLGVA